MKDKYLIVLTTIFAILSCIAIGFGDTTLVPSTVPTLVAWIRYVIALLAFFCIMKKVPVFSQIIRYRIIVYSNDISYLQKVGCFFTTVEIIFGYIGTIFALLFTVKINLSDKGYILF